MKRKSWAATALPISNVNVCAEATAETQISATGASKRHFLKGSCGGAQAGAKHGVTFERPSLDGSQAQLKADLEGALIEQGLFPKEAAAMIDTWRDSWFEEGSRLIYILPESAVNAMLPLEINPAPERIARVFVGRIELITPETKRAVREAIAKKDRQTLALYRRFLEPIGKSLGEATNLSCQTPDER